MDDQLDCILIVIIEGVCGNVCQASLIMTHISAMFGALCDQLTEAMLQCL